MFLSYVIDDPNSNCAFESLGIFAYLNYLTPKSRKEILELLVVGLKRLEYRGYDSAGKSIFLNLEISFLSRKKCHAFMRVLTVSYTKKIQDI